jgi:hypothetical protein
MSTQTNTEEITLTEAILAITVKDAEVVVY